jgi:hypothetical protein
MTTGEAHLRGRRGCPARGGLGAGVLAISALAAASIASSSTASAAGQPGETPAPLIVTPLSGLESGHIRVVVTALASEPGRVVLENLAASLGGREVAVESQSFSGYASRQAAADSSWAPPFVVALVYYWGEDAPQEILDGVHSLFKALPGRTTVYPVHYGEGRRTYTAPRTASDLAGGDLDTVPKIPGSRPTIARAVRFAAGEVAKEKAPLRFLILITDGRDHDLGEDPAGFSALGQQLLQAGIATEVVAFPAPLDRGLARRQIQALTQGARGRLLEARSTADLAGTIEAASLVFLDMVVATVKVPVAARLWSGDVPLRIETRYGGARAVGQTSIRLGGSLRWLLSLGILALAAAVAVSIFFGWPQRARQQRQEMLEHIERWVRAGVKPERMVVDLSRRFPEQVAWLKTLDPDQLDTARSPHLRTRAGRALLEQIQAKLAAAGDPAVTGSAESNLVGQLAMALSAGLSPADASERIRARLPDEDWSAFARLGFRDLTRLLKDASAQHPALGTPEGRRLVMDVQDALRESSVEGLSVAWLVRAAGPGPRGATLPLGQEETTLGRAEGAGVRLQEDSEVAARHAVVRLIDGRYAIAPAEGPVLVEGEPITAERPLADGETIQIGREVLVFKCVVAG